MSIGHPQSPCTPGPHPDILWLAAHVTMHSRSPSWHSTAGCHVPHLWHCSFPSLPVLANIEPPIFTTCASDRLLNWVELHPDWPLNDGSGCTKLVVWKLSVGYCNELLTGWWSHHPTIRLPGFHLPWRQLSLLNRFQTGQGHCWRVWLRRHPDSVIHRQLLPHWPNLTAVYTTSTHCRTRLLSIGWHHVAPRRVWQQQYD